MSWITQDSRGGTLLAVHAVPRSSRDAVQGLHGQAVKIRLRAPPVEGRANAALVRFLAEALNVPKGRVVLLAGAAGREKRVHIAGLEPAAVRARLGLPAADGPPLG